MNNIMKKDLLREYGAIIALTILVITLSVISSDFRDPKNFISLLRQSSINGLIAFGMTLVILTGAIDLSVGSVLALTAMSAAYLVKFMSVPTEIAMILSLVLGVLLGSLSGVFVAVAKLQPFIATLVTMTGYRALTKIISGSKPISGVGTGTILMKIGKASTPIWILLIVFIILFFILKKTTFGRQIYATGSNSKAAELAGVDIKKIQISVYAVSGFLSALTGLILISRLGGSAQPVLGEGYELDAIAAVALGGTSMNGGKGKIFGTLVGILIIAVLNNGLNILNVQSYYQDLAKALVILFAVLADKKK